MIALIGAINLRFSSSLQGIARASTALRLLRSSVALCASGCSVSRKTLNEQRELRTAEVVRDTVVVFRDVAVTDTVREVTTMTVDRTEAGDTVFRSVVTDRERLRDRVAVSDVREKVVVVRDTVFIEKRDSVAQVVVAAGAGVEIDKDGNVTRKVNRLAQTLRWVFAVVVGLVILILVVRFGRKGLLF